MKKLIIVITVISFFCGCYIDRNYQARRDYKAEKYWSAKKVVPIK